ncbi:MAG: hypothetical protein QXJ55_08140 [Candidatus Caldarchaeum sp.]
MIQAILAVCTVAAASICIYAAYTTLGFPEMLNSMWFWAGSLGSIAAGVTGVAVAPRIGDVDESESEEVLAQTIRMPSPSYGRSPPPTSPVSPQPITTPPPDEPKTTVDAIEQAIVNAILNAKLVGDMGLRISFEPTKRTIAGLPAEISGTIVLEGLHDRRQKPEAVERVDRQEKLEPPPAPDPSEITSLQDLIMKKRENLRKMRGE